MALPIDLCICIKHSTSCNATKMQVGQVIFRGGRVTVIVVAQTQMPMKTWH